MLAVRLSFVLAFVVSASVPTAWVSAVHQTENQRDQGLIENLFGPEVRGHRHLFELNKDYIVKVQFDGRAQTSSVMVIPKYYLEECEPSWTEPSHQVGLTEGESREILAKIEKLKRVGAPVSRGTTGVVTNSKLWLLDQYQSAFVRRLLNRTAQDPEDRPETIHSLSVYFIRNVEGVVEDKQIVNEFGMEKQLRLKIDGCWYLTTESEFPRAKVGSRALLQAAGPIDRAKLCP